MREPEWMRPARRSGNEYGFHFVVQVSGTFSCGPIGIGCKTSPDLCWHTVAWRACCTPRHRELRNELCAAPAAGDCATCVSGTESAADLAHHPAADPGLHLCQSAQ